jgi:CubicO group peptidase (beta-lactamase class C family)
VVDLWGGYARPGQPWEEDTLAVMFSATKGLAGICVMQLVDRGLLDPDALVTEYWPEFGQAGKEGTTVRHVLEHTAGLIGLEGHADLLSWGGKGFDDYDAIAAALARTPAAWEPGTKQGYHALTYGWIVGELVRRVDGRTIGAFFHEEIAGPLGLDTWIGVSPEDRKRVATVIDIGYHAVPGPLRAQVAALQIALRDPSTFNGQAFLGDGTASGVDHLAELSNGDMLEAEFASGGGTSTARSLARAFAVLGAGGTFDGRTFVSEATMSRFDRMTSSYPDELAREVARSKSQKKAADQPVPRVGPHLKNTTGRLALPDLFGPNPSSMGAAGAGGQIVFFDRDTGLTVASLRSHMAIVDLAAPAIVDVVYACAARNGDIDAARIPKPTAVRRLVRRPLHAYLRRLERKSLTPPPA